MGSDIQNFIIIIYLFIIIYYLFLMCTIKKKKKERKRKESKRTDALKVAKETRAIRGPLEGSRAPGSGAPAPPAARGLGWAWASAPRRPRHPSRATAAWLGAGSSLKLFSFLVFLFK